MNAVIGLAEFFVGAVLIAFVGTIASVIAVSLLPRDNPLRQTLHALCYRLMATFGAAVVAIPMEAIPGINVLYDVSVPVLLAVYWLSFFWNAMHSSGPTAPPPSTSYQATSSVTPSRVRDIVDP